MDGTFSPAVTMNDISSMVKAMHNEHRASPVSKGEDLMRGKLHFLSPMPGCFLHWCDVEEMQTAASASELKPCLSFTLLIKGRIRFAVGGEKYNLDASNSPMCSAITLNQSELLTRFTQVGQRARKINIMISKEWLVKRCAGGSGPQQIQQFLSHGENVHMWQPDENLVALAERVLNLNTNSSLRDRLALEETLFRLVRLVIDQLESKSYAPVTKKDTANNTYSYSPQLSDNSLKKRIDQIYIKKTDLVSIAKELNMSISTLQRKFSTAYGLTVMEYVRMRRLELARDAILFKGMSIGEAAYLAGYNHPSNFISAFKRQFNKTPKDLTKIVSG